MTVIENPRTWDDRTGRHFYSCARWLGFCADDYGLDVSGVVGRGVDGDVAVPVVDGLVPRGTPYGWNDALAARNLPLLAERGLLVGPREGYQTHLLAPAGPGPEAVRDLLANLRARAGDGACVAMYLDAAGVRAFRDAGVQAPAVLLEPDAWIEVPEGGFDAWLQARPRGRRSTIRQELRAFAEAGLAIEHTSLGECLDEVVPLAVATLAKHGDGPVVAAEERAALLHHHEHLGDRARVVLCRRDGEAVGFSLTYRWGDTVHLRWVGFDYDRLLGAAEYFNVTYYAILRGAAEDGVRWIHAGLRTLAAKVARGAALSPLFLLDLAADSRLRERDEQIRADNRAAYRRLADEPTLARGLADPAPWEGVG